MAHNVFTDNHQIGGVAGMNNNQGIGISEDQIFAYIGRLTMENQWLKQQLALLQQQIAQQAQANGKEADAPREVVEVAKKGKA